MKAYIWMTACWLAVFAVSTTTAFSVPRHVTPMMGKTTSNNSDSKRCTITAATRTTATTPETQHTKNDSSRRAFVDHALLLPFLLSVPQVAAARAPGSTDTVEAVRQIQDAAVDLRRLQRDFYSYAVVNDEGRAVTDATVGARRILGGVAPLAGTSAIEVAKVTPLYRIDGAFNVIRKACIEGTDGDVWTDNLDLGAYEELVERILFQLQKADGDFYSVQFAAKGTKQISGIYKEAKEQVDQGVIDFDKILSLLEEANAPGF